MVRPIRSEYPKCKEGIAAVRVRLGASTRHRGQNVLTILIAEAVLSPHASRSVDSMDSVNESIAACQLSFGAFDSWVTEQSRWHTWPAGEYDECEEIANGESSSPSLI